MTVVQFIQFGSCTVCSEALIWRKPVPGKRVTIPAESTLARVYIRKTLTRPRTSSDCLALTELTRLGEPKRLCVVGQVRRETPSPQSRQCFNGVT